MENVLTGPTTETVEKETRINVKKLIQISFAGDADLALIKGQLSDVRDQFSDAKFAHLFLPRKIVEEKGFNTAIVDMLDEVLGENQYNPLAEAANFDEFMSKIDEERLALAAETSLLVVLGTSIADGVLKEVNSKSASILFWK